MKIVNHLSPKGGTNFFSLTHMGRGDVKETFPLLATLAIFSDDVEFRNSNARVLQKK